MILNSVECVARTQSIAQIIQINKDFVVFVFYRKEWPSKIPLDNKNHEEVANFFGKFNKFRKNSPNYFFILAFFTNVTNM